MSFKNLIVGLCFAFTIALTFCNAWFAGTMNAQYNEILKINKISEEPKQGVPNTPTDAPKTTSAINPDLLLTREQRETIRKNKDETWIVQRLAELETALAGETLEDQVKYNRSKGHDEIKRLRNDLFDGKIVLRRPE